ncbi:hydantoinase/oxoprolinase family protein [Planotetraspora sp. A-T 1434]|uniref:hydantoinase/oxoprolinase family protein n=1 Tax=Planotetraspora sp. A-T 1434 TaxID=2979219 RepID=UPI0021BF6ED1|nr:hydantoinase/oxoprolinase family protein [Planotetraspora sp. A-T 1434]MCT9932515.1 hydantoinase/oxoprolinase family protein [Planotetraspora sp. A-T 1434]
MTTVIGVDVGGTFTDLVLHDAATGEIRVAKQPTTPAAPELGVLAAVDAAVPAELLARCDHFVHGTTVGLNALLERPLSREKGGAAVGLITTAGFRDVLEIRRGDRDDPYDLFWTPPPPLVPRRLRAEVAERVAADGSVVRELDPETVRQAARLFAAEGVDAVAIVLVNSYANPAHEALAAGLLREAGFDGPISLSHEVSGEYREYERTCTTVVDAFVRHRMGPYLHNLNRELRARGFGGGLLVTRSGGGALTLSEAAARPFETILSGPVAGAVATARLSATLGLRTAVAADVGGTSFDTALIEDGRLPLLFQGEVVGLPLQSPWVDVRSVGAGGGSIAYADSGGLLRVGPRSAGADPGPVSYRRGGAEATVTDAALHLGMIPAGHISGGISLSPGKAAEALAPLAGPTGIDGTDAVAEGVIRIAAAHMAQAVRGVTVERGVDPRGTAIVAFGGAGPLFGCLLADELDVDTVVIPPNAGNFSAVGLVQADIVRSAARTLVRALDEEALPVIERLAASLFERLAGSDAPPGAGAVREVDLDLRHRGQEHTLTIPLRLGDDDVAAVGARFSGAYHRTFGHELPDPLEVVTVRATSRVVLDDEHPLVPAPPAGATPLGTTRLWSFRERAHADAPVVPREGLAGPMEGPLLVIEPTATTYVDAGFAVEAHPSGCLIITRKDGDR